MPVAGSSPGQASVGVYITYVRKEDAAKAIAAIDGSIWDGKILRYETSNTGSIGAKLEHAIHLSITVLNI